MAQTIGMILSAGFGTRLQPLTFLRPKPVMEIGGRPILYFLIRMLEQAGINDIIINLHHQPEFIHRFIEKSDFKARIHLIHEPTILGTAGGVRNALFKLGIGHKSMVVMHGDILCDLDLAPFLTDTMFCSLICESNRSISEYLGSVGVDSQGLITELGQFYHSMSRTSIKGFFTGIQVLSPAAVEMLKLSQQESLVADVYPKWLLKGHGINGIMMPLVYEDLGSRERIFAANMAILNNPQRFSHIDFLQGYTGIENQIYVGPGVVVDKEAILQGPLMIARDARIGKGARVGPNVIVGERSLVDDGAMVKNSIIMSDTSIEKIERLDCTLALLSARVLVKV